MLPDFPETKKLFSIFLHTYMQRKLRELSPFQATKAVLPNNLEAFHVSAVYFWII